MIRAFKSSLRVPLGTSLKKYSTNVGPNFLVLGESSALRDIVKSPESKVLYFTATWCPPCKMIAPIFEKLSKDFPTTKFVKIDIDDHSDAAAEFKIRSVPTFMFYKGSNLKEQVNNLIYEWY